MRPRVNPALAQASRIMCTQVPNTRTVEVLIEAIKLVRGMRKTLRRRIKFHRFDQEWGQLWIDQWCDANDKLAHMIP